MDGIFPGVNVKGDSGAVAGGRPFDLVTLFDVIEHLPKR
jgi:hypothetical protein